MYQFITAIQALKNLENGVTKVMTINALNDISKNTLAANWRLFAIHPAGHVSHGALSKTPLNEKFDVEEVLNNYDAFRKHILELVCIRMHESLEAWTII